MPSPNRPASAVTISTASWPMQPHFSPISATTLYAEPISKARCCRPLLTNISTQGSGDQKFIPGLNDDTLQKLSAAASPRSSELYKQISGPIQAIPPFGLGYPSETTQSSYYLGDISQQGISLVSRLLEQHSLFPENTRIRKAENGVDFEILLASVQRGGASPTFPLPDGDRVVRLVQGDHSDELKQICTELSQAVKYAANDRQRGFLQAYAESFQTGSLDAYRESQRIWVRDKAPRVENILGFVEPYRDPHGIRAEFEGLVAIADEKESKLLAKLVENSAKFIQRLPWATAENDGKGPFEKSLFEPPDFSSIHGEPTPLPRRDPPSISGILTTHSSCILLEHHLSGDQPSKREPPRRDTSSSCRTN